MPGATREPSTDGTASKNVVEYVVEYRETVSEGWEVKMHRMVNAIALFVFSGLILVSLGIMGDGAVAQSTARTVRSVALLQTDGADLESASADLRSLVQSGDVKIAARADGSVFIYATPGGAAALKSEGVEARVVVDDVAGRDLYLIPVLGQMDIGHLSGNHRVVASTASHLLLEADPLSELEIHLLPFKERLPAVEDAGLPLSRPPAAARTSSGAPLAYDPLIQKMADSVSEARLYETLSGLSGENPVMIGGEPYTIYTRYSPVEGCKKAGQFILETFEAMGLDADYDYFNFRTQLRDVCFPVDNQRGWAVGRQTMVLHTEDGGQVWEKQHTGDDGALNSVVMVDAEHGCVVGNNGIVLVTADGGTWQRVYPPTSEDLMSLCFVDESTAYCCGANGTILKSVDAGYSWTVLASGTGRDLYGICFADPTTGWVVGEYGTIRKTVDGGADWSAVSSPVSVDLTDVSCVDASKAWACGLSGVMVGTVDGLTWSEATTPVGEDLKSVFFLNSQRGWACGTAGTVVRTTDGGSTWNQLDFPWPLNLEGIFFPNAGEGWAVGLGAVCYTATGGLAWEDRSDGVRSGDRNVVATLPGTSSPEEIYIICGHYDSISESPETYAPGADDNGTGSVGVIEAARVLRNYSFEATLRFVCFAREEQGLVGSHAYCIEARERGDSIVGALNFDMIGYVDIAPEDVDILYNGISGWLADEYQTAASLYVPDLDIVKTFATHVGSDNSSFWDCDYPAFCGIEDGQLHNPYYHRTTDRISNISFDFYTNVVRAAVASLARLARVDTLTSSVAGTFEPAVLRISPNPGRGEITVKMNGLSGAAEGFQVYDVGGRLINTIAAEVHGATASGTWWGNDAAGAPVAPGVYFIRPTGSAEGTKVVLLK
jgi:photosystem II stability/assembly factor-like uncharacterized protein